MHAFASVWGSSDGGSESCGNTYDPPMSASPPELGAAPHARAMQWLPALKNCHIFTRIA